MRTLPKSSRLFESYDAAIEVAHEAPAEQYRESLRMVLPKSESCKRSELWRKAENAVGLPFIGC